MSRAQTCKEVIGSTSAGDLMDLKTLLGDLLILLVKDVISNLFTLFHKHVLNVKCASVSDAPCPLGDLLASLPSPLEHKSTRSKGNRTLLNGSNKKENQPINLNQPLPGMDVCDKQRIKF